MESIAVTKPGMGVLSQERLLLSPFGALAQAFSQEILDRARKEEGRWSYVPLDLLEEGEESQTAPAVPPVIQVDLHLVLEALRREKGESEQRRATERIVERILQQTGGPVPGPPAPGRENARLPNGRSAPEYLTDPGAGEPLRPLPFGGSGGKGQRSV